MNEVINPGRHIHRALVDPQGRMICQDCNRVLIEPITDSDDPRLVDAGLMRSPHHYQDHEELNLPPLPEVLIALYYNADAIGLPKAPIAPYVHYVALQHVNADPDTMWLDLYNHWSSHA